MKPRGAERTRSLLRAQIVFNNRMSAVDCIVKNISPLGARLMVTEAVSVPSHFELEVSQKNRSHQARMIWRDADSIGVAFVPASEAGGEDKGPDGRVAALERQNAELKAKIRALSKRLADLGQDPDLAA